MWAEKSADRLRNAVTEEVSPAVPVPRPTEEAASPVPTRNGVSCIALSRRVGVMRGTGRCSLPMANWILGIRKTKGQVPVQLVANTYR